MLDTIVNTKYRYKYVVSSLLCFVCLSNTRSCITDAVTATIDAPLVATLIVLMHHKKLLLLMQSLLWTLPLSLYCGSITVI